MSFYGEKSGGDVKFRKTFTTSTLPNEQEKIIKQDEEDEEIKLVNARTESTDITVNLNKTQVVQGLTVNRQPGFYCEICDCNSFYSFSNSYMIQVQ